MGKQITLPDSGIVATIKETISYGDHQDMQTALMKAAKGDVNPVTKEVKAEFDASSTIAWTFAKLLIMVIKLVDKDYKEIPVTEKSIRDLSVLDGQTLEEETDAILESIKKKQD